MDKWRVYIVLFLACAGVWGAQAQNILVPLTDTRLYDYIDELATDGVIQINEAVRPYTRRQIAHMLSTAQQHESLLNKRQREDLAFYLNEFAIERDTMRQQFVQYTDHQTYNLSLADPQFTYMTRDKNFKMQLRPILGMDIIGSKKGAILKRWWGAELQMDIVHHLSIWGSLRDISWNGNFLKGSYFPNGKIDGAKLTKAAYLNNLSGVQYKEANYGGDFSDSKGGINLYSWWGSIGLGRENVRWGDAYHCSNILSGRNPAVPQLSLQLTPVWWFQFDYFHAWLNSNVLSTTDYYLEQISRDSVSRQYRPQPKYMAANMFSFLPCRYVHFSIGNSIVYAENQPQAAYFIPIAFYKSLDHLLTKGISTQNQNSQVFLTMTVRPTSHLKLYSSVYADEVKWSRFKASSQAKNPISYLVGLDWTGWPIKGLGVKAEFMRAHIACYTQSIEALTYASNSYCMGHYMGDNAQSIFAELSYRPIRGMWLAINYTDDTKYNPYAYVRGDIGEAISQKPFDDKVFCNRTIGMNLVYEVHHNMYLRAELTYNDAQGYDNLTPTCESEICRSASSNLNAYAPVFYQGKNITGIVGFSFGF